MGGGARRASTWGMAALEPIWPPMLMAHGPVVVGDILIPGSLSPACQAILHSRVWEGDWVWGKARQSGH